jgi:hypothetical protein
MPWLQVKVGESQLKADAAATTASGVISLHRVYRWWPPLREGHQRSLPSVCVKSSSPEVLGFFYPKNPKKMKSIEWGDLSRFLVR